MLTLENRKVLKSGIEIPTSRNMKKEEAINPKQGGKRKQKQKSVSLKQENMEYYSANKKNTFESVLMRWMKLEPIIQSEVSQKEKHKYSILTHVCGI